MKKVILFISLITLMFSAYAQSGATCSTAKVFVSNDTCINNDTLSSTEKWYSFVASGNVIDIGLTLVSFSQDHVHKMLIYSGACSNLTAFDSVEVTSSNDTILYLHENNLIDGNTYYIKVSESSTCSTRCSSSDAIFNLCLGVLGNGDANCGLNPGPISTPYCNILCNGNFDTFWICPVSLGELANTYCWNIDSVEFDPVGAPGLYNCLGPNGGSPDFFHTNDCPASSTVYEVSVPVNWAGVEANNSGGTGGYAGILTFDKRDQSLSGIINTSDPLYNYREYLQQKLSIPMIIGKKYRLKTYLSLSDSSAVANYVGVLFGTVAYNETSDTYINRTPTFETPSIITNKVGWTLFDTTFVADSAYSWMIIGNFRPDVSTNMTVLDPTLVVSVFVPGFGVIDDQMGYYYLDDISITPLDSIITTVFDADSTICDGQSITMETSLTIFQQLDYQWSSVPLDTSLTSQQNDSLVTVSPHDTTIYYVIIKDIYGCLYFDTIQINVVPLPVKPLIVGDSFACVTGTPIPYSITNYDSTLVYTVTFLPIITGATASAVDSTGTFTVTWSDNNGAVIVVIVGDSTSGCDSTAEFLVRPCCIYGDTTFVNDSASHMIAYYGSSFLGSENFSINGTFTIDQSLDWSDCNVKLGIDAVIYILSGDTLYITQTSELSACASMWDRIHIEPGAFLHIDGNSIVEDGKRVVYSDAGGEYELRKALFNRNYKNVVLTPYLGPHQGIIEDCKFTCQPILGSTAFLNAPYIGYRTEVGVEINNVASVTIGSATAGTNLFKNMNIGINSIQSSVNVYNNEFRAISLGTFPNSGVAAITATGDKFAAGYVARTLTVGNGIASGLNFINSCVNGVIAQENINVIINYNDFKSTTLRAIYIKNNKAFNTVSISKNSITNFSTAITCEQNNICNSIITLNVIKGSASASNSIGIVLTDINSTLATYTIFNNDIEKVRTGVNSRSVSRVIVNGNRITIKPQVFGSFASGQGVLLSNNISTSVTSNIISCSPLSSNTNVKGVFVQDSPNTLVKCNEVHKFGASIHFDGPANTFGTVYNNLMKTATYGFWLSNGTALGNQGGPSSPGVASDNKWQGTFTQHTFVSGTLITVGNNSKIFYRNTGIYVPSLNSSVPLGITMIPQAVTPTNFFPSVCAFPPPASAGHKAMLLVAKDSLYTTQELKWLSKHAVYRELEVDSTLFSGDTILVNFRDSLALQNMGKLYDALQIAGENNASNFVTAKSSINALAITEPIEDYLKIVIDIALEKQITGVDFGSVELSTLRNIAEMCPYNEGTGVYIARSLIMPYDAIGTEYENSCETEGIRTMSFVNDEPVSTITDNKFLLFPNPNNGSMTLNYEINETDNASLFIYDITGREISNYKMNANNNSLVIKENELSNGIYLYKVIINGKTAKSDRLVIIK